MTLGQKILPQAQVEFDEAVRWYAKEKKGLGRKFAAAVKAVLKRLRKMPTVHGFVVNDIRRALVPGFPYYVVLYRVTDVEVIIISIFHTSQDPWK